jgi:hypothetical protein
MELLNMTVGGVSIGTLLLIWGVWYMVSNCLKDWGEQRERKRELDEADKEFKEEYEWKPMMVGGADCGKWVRKDGPGRSMAKLDEKRVDLFYEKLTG